MSTELKLSLASFLNSSIEEMPDAPTRAMLPAGRHILQVKDCKQKELGNDKKEALTILCTYVETQELVNSADAVLKPQEEVDFTFMTDNAYGIGRLKEFLKPLASPGVTLADILQAVVGQQVIITTKVRQWKDANSGEKREGHEAVGGMVLLGG